jgi:hypothetical protein
VGIVLSALPSLQLLARLDMQVFGQVPGAARFTASHETILDLRDVSSQKEPKPSSASNDGVFQSVTGIIGQCPQRVQ